jgi:hypothetical protein
VSYIKIGSVELTGSESKIQFASIPGGYTHLEAVWTLGNGAGISFVPKMTFNDVIASASYYWVAGGAVSTAENTTTNTSDTSMSLTHANNANFGKVFIPYYSDSTLQLTYWSNSGGSAVWSHSSGVAGTNATGNFSTNAQYTLTSLEFLGTFVAGDKIDLYAF